jgi:hypothetical protein
MHNRVNSISTPSGVLSIIQPLSYAGAEQLMPACRVEVPPSVTLDGRPIAKKRALEILSGMRRSSK